MPVLKTGSVWLYERGCSPRPRRTRAHTRPAGPAGARRAERRPRRETRSGHGGCAQRGAAGASASGGASLAMRQCSGMSLEGVGLKLKKLE